MHVQRSLVFVVLIPLIVETFTVFHRHYQSRAKRSTTNACCISSKLNVVAKKANNGREFFQKLATETDSYKSINPENMCNLMHFLIQQAKLNNKSVSFTKGK